MTIPSQLKCPKCGSEEVIEVGTSRAMCQECYEVFDIKPGSQPKPAACPICGDNNQETDVDECPMCGRKNICKKHLDEAGLCPDCSRALDEASRNSSPKTPELQPDAKAPKDAEYSPAEDKRTLAGKMAPFLLLFFLALGALLFGMIKCVIDTVGH